MGASPPLPRGLVLLIDDQAVNVRLLSLFLTSSGYTVISAPSGEAGLLLARSARPDVVLLDLRMPKMDGFEVLAVMQAEEALRQLPVILLTADNSRECLERAFDGGAADFVAKPFVPLELLARVRLHAELKQTRDALRRVDRSNRAAARLVADDLRGHFAKILVAAELQRVLPQAPPTSIALANDIRVSANAGLQFLQAVLDAHDARIGSTATVVVEPRR